MNGWYSTTVQFFLFVSFFRCADAAEIELKQFHDDAYLKLPSSKELRSILLLYFKEAMLKPIPLDTQLGGKVMQKRDIKEQLSQDIAAAITESPFLEKSYLQVHEKLYDQIIASCSLATEKHIKHLRRIASEKSSRQPEKPKNENQKKTALDTNNQAWVSVSVSEANEVQSVQNSVNQRKKNCCCACLLKIFWCCG